MGDSVDKLREILWCNHCSVIPGPLFTANQPHVFIQQPVYLVVEEGKIKLLCDNCWRIAVSLHSKPPIESLERLQ